MISELTFFMSKFFYEANRASSKFINKLRESSNSYKHHQSKKPSFPIIRFDEEKLSSETANVVWRKFHFSRFNELTFISSQALRQGGEETEKKFSDEPAVNCGGNKGRK